MYMRIKRHYIIPMNCLYLYTQQLHNNTLCPLYSTCNFYALDFLVLKILKSSKTHIKYCTPQFKHDRTCMRYGLNTTHFTFYTRASMDVHVRLMMSNLSFRALVYTSDMCMIVCRCMRACQECTCQIWIACILACMQVVSQVQRYKLYEHVHVQRCDSMYKRKLC